jgi:exodeoxyribonuclease VII small subunit
VNPDSAGEADRGRPTAGPGARQPIDLESLDYEQARDELAAAVQRLEAGGLTLEESLALWERGEALAAHCQAKLDSARARLDAAAGGGAAR